MQVCGRCLLKNKYATSTVDIFIYIDIWYCLRMRYFYLTICVAIFVTVGGIFAGTGFEIMLDAGYEHGRAKMIGATIGGSLAMILLAFSAGALAATRWGAYVLSEAAKALEELISK